MTTWQVTRTKDQLFKIVKVAQTQGPQFFVNQGKITAVLLSNDCYEKLTKKSRPLYDFLINSPLAEAEDVSFERDKSLTREVSI